MTDEVVTIPARTAIAHLSLARIIFNGDAPDEIFVHRVIDGQQESETAATHGTDADFCDAIGAAGGRVTIEQLRSAWLIFGGKREAAEAQAITVSALDRRSARAAEVVQIEAAAAAAAATNDKENP
jgi:hypothetical protein